MPYKDPNYKRDYNKKFREDPANRERARERQAERTTRNNRMVRELKDNPCTDCGKKYPHYVMDFDHRGDEAKMWPVSRGKHRAIKTILAEIAKCDLVCSNCHRERTHQRRVAANVPEED